MKKSLSLTIYVRLTNSGYFYAGSHSTARSYKRTHADIKNLHLIIVCSEQGGVISQRLRQLTREQSWFNGK